MPEYKFRPGADAEISLEEATDGAGEPKAFNDSRQVNWLVEGAGTIDAGVVKIESAHDPNYAGIWNELDSIDAVTLTGGKLYGNTYPMPPGGFVRGRIDDPITGGGTITVRLNGYLS
jgi:hypothetical protein